MREKIEKSELMALRKLTKAQNNYILIQNKNIKFYRNRNYNQRILDKTENLRQLNEIKMVKDLPLLNYKEKFNSIMQLCDYYIPNIQDKIIELEESTKQV